MKVIVTREDIINGKRGDCWACPIALAVSRLFPNSKVQVIFHTMTVDNRGYRLPGVATDLIRVFDRGDRPQPLEFEVSDEFFDASTIPE